MHNRVMLLAVAIAAIAGATASGAVAHPQHSHRGPAYVCTGRPVEYDPQDLNQMRAPVDAAARLALAIRQREYLASCHPVRRSRHLS